MPDKSTSWETLSAQGTAILDKLADLVHQGNVRRVIIEHQGRTVAEFPLTAGVVGAVLAPVLAAAGAVIALLQNCTIHVERELTGAEEPVTRPEDTPAGNA